MARDESPEAQAGRRERKRERTRERVRRHRAKAKAAVTTLLGNALGRVTGNTYMPTVRPETVADKTAQSILSNTLASYGVTVDKVVRTVAEGLDATRFKVINGKEALQPDSPQRLRGADIAIRLMERSGAIPADRRPDSMAHITVNILQLTDLDEEPPPTITIESTTVDDPEAA